MSGSETPWLMSKNGIKLRQILHLLWRIANAIQPFGDATVLRKDFLLHVHNVTALVAAGSQDADIRSPCERQRAWTMHQKVIGVIEEFQIGRMPCK